MTPTLGGPGVACSELRVRRLVAGELAGDALERARAHVEGCARCTATRARLADEEAALRESLPFPAFAAGVAERLARTAAPPSVRRPRRPRAALGLGLALAAGLAAVVAVPFTAQRRAPGTDARPKGALALTVHVADATGVRALAPGEPVPPRAALRLSLSGTAGGHAAVALLDADGVAILHAGPVVAGPLPSAFEWTGDGDGVLVAVVDAGPVDVDALARRLEAGGPDAASPGGRAEVAVRPLRRAR